MGAVDVDPGRAGPAAGIVLPAGEGLGTNEIVRRTGASEPTVILWKKRYAAEGTCGLEDRPRVICVWLMRRLDGWPTSGSA